MSIHNKQAQKAAGISLDDFDSKTAPAADNRTPRTAPGQLMNLQGKYQQALAENESLKQQLQESGTRELPIDELHEVEGRRRKLSDEEYRDLKENLRNNPLVQAITVRARKAGGYEIISGNNRVAIYRELGRPSILAVVQTMDDENADLAGFYANLLQPTLPDFEKFIGFKRRQMLTNKSQKELADEAGISVATVSAIFSFDKLPEAAKDLLTQKPHVLGSKAASKLAAAVEDGKEQRVLEALQRLVTDEAYTQNQAVAYASAKSGAAAASTTVKPVVINSGKKKFCQLEARSGKVAISFADPGQAEGWLKKFEAFIRSEMQS